MGAGESPLDAASVEKPAGEEHPELFVAVALAGGFILAQILKRFGRD